MARGISLHVGLNGVDPARYEGWDGRLQYAEADARDMSDLARQAGFAARSLLSSAATCGAVLEGIQQAAATLQSGDIFFLSYSGHGGQVRDTNGDEDDGLDETLCLFNGQLIDDQLADAWTRFRSGVRVLYVSDSCHSGTQFKVLFDGLKALGRLDLLLPLAARRDTPPERPPVGVARETPTPRAMPQFVAEAVYARYRDEYTAVQSALPAGDGPNAPAAIQASVMILPACRDEQESAEWGGNGLFTDAIKHVWNGGAFQGDYRQFEVAVGKATPATQTPIVSMTGAPNPDFIRQRPFTI